jgi:NarL family two-component system sensor histidine kinase LiaS
MMMVELPNADTEAERTGGVSDAERRDLVFLAQTIEVHERKWEQICLDVHDGLTQTLTGTFAQLQVVAMSPDLSESLRPRINRIAALVRTAIQEARGIVAQLRPAALNSVGLVTTMQIELDDLGKSSGLLVTCELEPVCFSREVETAIYRIFHEAITNVIKHARAAVLAASLERVGDDVVLRLVDDGIGFDSSKLADLVQQQHFGILSMTKRSELLGGHLRLESSPGNGTSITVMLPSSVLAGAADGEP